MKPTTKDLWKAQDRHVGDRWRLFQAIGNAVEAEDVLYPGSFVDIAPSFVFPNVTYVDSDSRVPGFFADDEGVLEIIRSHPGSPPMPAVSFQHSDYTTDLALQTESFDLLISLYAGFVSEHCTQYLRVGGTLLANPSHGDVAMASIDPRYQLVAVVTSRSGEYRVTTKHLDTYLIPKSDRNITVAYLHETGRGIAYTKSPFAYVFERTS